MANASPLHAQRSSNQATDNANFEQNVIVRRAGILVCGILMASVLSLSAAGLCTMKYPVVFSHALLAFALGLRHAVDIDHLAAIDNVTRQLLQKGQRPVSVGFWFAVGHSCIVLFLTMLLAGGYTVMYQQINKGTQITEWIGLFASCFSVLLLAGIGCLNAKIALDLFLTWARLCSSHSGVVEQDCAAEDESQGALRTAIASLPFLQRAFDRIDRPEKMLVIGVLFGLGFDTATQVGLIGLAAISGSQGSVPPWMILIFPLCFCCGMCLVDTVNGLLMLMTYRWASVRPMEKIFYNFVVTALSACIALIIGTLELLQIIATQWNLKGWFWDSIKSVDMGFLGYMLIGTFCGILFASICWWKCHACKLCAVVKRSMPGEMQQSLILQQTEAIAIGGQYPYR